MLTWHGRSPLASHRLRCLPLEGGASLRRYSSGSLAMFAAILRAPISIAVDVSCVCKGLPEMVPAMGSRCKNRDYPPKYYLCGSSLRTSDTGSPNTRHLSRCLLPRTRGHRRKLGWSKFQTTSPLQEQRHQISVFQGFSTRRALRWFPVSS